MTAVEWLIGQIKDDWFLAAFYDEFNQAKEMEKQQIIDAYEDGYSDSDNTFELNKNYYNEIFNK